MPVLFTIGLEWLGNNWQFLTVLALFASSGFAASVFFVGFIKSFYKHLTRPYHRDLREYFCYLGSTSPLDLDTSTPDDLWINRYNYSLWMARRSNVGHIYTKDIPYEQLPEMTDDPVFGVLIKRALKRRDIKKKVKACGIIH